MDLVEKAPAATAPELIAIPYISDKPLKFIGFGFESGERLPSLAGVFILGRQVAGRVFPAYVGEGEDMALAAGAAASELGADASETDIFCWLETPLARRRSYIAREIIGKLHPPLNVEFRRARSPAEISSLIPDRARLSPVDAVKLPSVGDLPEISEETIERLVREFYRDAHLVPELSAVFTRTIDDFEQHVRIVSAFWSRQLRGTGHYKGSPYGVHVNIGLTPEHFGQWLEVFRHTARRVLEPVLAEFAIAKVEHMARCFQTGLFLPPQ